MATMRTIGTRPVVGASYLEMVSTVIRASEADLISAAVRGDDAAFDALVGPLIEPGYKLAAVMLRDPAEAQDAVQEACFIAWRKLVQVRTEGGLRPWFLAIVANQCRTRRRMRWWSVITLPSIREEPHMSDSDLDSDLDLDREVRKLSATERAALLLFFYMDLPLVEVARVLKVSPHAAKSRVHRAVVKLRMSMVEVPPVTDQQRDRIAAAFERELARSPVPPRLRAQAVHDALHGHSANERQRQPVALALVAALLAIAIVATLLFAARSLHSRQVVPAIPVPHGFGLCQVSCNVRSGSYAIWFPQFASANVGWMTKSVLSTGPGSAEFPALPAETYLYRTDDGGAHWRPQLSWDGPGAEAIRVSADGTEALVVTAEGRTNEPPTAPLPLPYRGLFHTTDAGAHWTALGLPLPAALGSQVYFLNPREGWVLSIDATPGLADLFRTSDSGGHWSLVTRLNINAQFNLQGRLIMLSSSRGWFLPSHDPAYPPFIYFTLDGGASWQVQTVKAPNGVQFSANSAIKALQFFNDQEGVLEVTTDIRDSTYEFNCVDASVRRFVYTTSDGGTHWTDPTQVPLPNFSVPLPAGEILCERIVFADVNHWVAETDKLLRTNDAGRHWVVLVPGFPPGFGASFLYFLDASHGWAFNSSGPMYRTSDGGANWIQGSLPG